MKSSFPLLTVIIPAMIICLAGCSNPTGPNGKNGNTGYSQIKEVIFKDQTATVKFNNLSNSNIYLVKVNKSASIVPAANTGKADDFSPDLNDDTMQNASMETLAPMDHPAAIEFNASPPPVIEEPYRRLAVRFIPPVTGDKRNFWVETYFNSSIFEQKQATLSATGLYGNIWVMDDNKIKLTPMQAQTLSDKFDLIYKAETNLLGFEYGGGPNGDGGRDGDPKIQILIHDIVDSTGTVMAAGYFWSKDYYPQSQYSNSNAAEIFYLDTSQVNSFPTYIYGTLIHEFQHMINFNMKYLKYGKSSATWYDEMLAMMSQDVISSIIDIGPTNIYHQTHVRIPTFLLNYNQIGITEWDSLNSISYAKGYAFGAYLLRNYGGPVLLKRILSNDTTNTDSITLALKEFSGGLSFELALARYGEALIYSSPKMPKGVMTFDKTVSSTISGIKYTAYGFNIWSDFSQKGPFVFDLNPLNLRPHSLTVHSAGDWKNKTGSYSITLEKPNDPNITLFLMAKQDANP